jgi:two-component system LytT family response regulator
LDYLLKPFSFAEFSKAAIKARTQFELMQNTQEPAEKIESNEDYLFIKSEYKLVRINLNDIFYIEGMKEYVRIHLSAQKPVMTLLSMKSVEAKLPSNKFMRVHRSYIVNLEKVSTVERFRIVFNDKTRIPVSDNYKEKFQKFLDKNFLS